MKFVSWNVNGLRAVLKKGFVDVVTDMDADIFAIQETKCRAGQVDFEVPGYSQIYSYAERPGYSGTAVFVKREPLQVIRQIFTEDEREADEEIALLDSEGRVLALEYDNFWFVCCYTPNAKNELLRIGPRLKWGERFKCFCHELESGKCNVAAAKSNTSKSKAAKSNSQKPVIICGDLNVAHNEIDLKNPSSNKGNAGFSDEERGDFTKLLDSGFTDTFRHLYPEEEGAYSWWSYRFNARSRNAGWRIDYFLVSSFVADKICEAKIHSDIMGSDHCPVSLDIDL